MKQQHQFSKEQQEQQVNNQVQKVELQFDSPEKLLRHDATHVVVPPRVEEKLQQSISELPAADKRPWWKKMLGG